MYGKSVIKLHTNFVSEFFTVASEQQLRIMRIVFDRILPNVHFPLEYRINGGW